MEVVQLLGLRGPWGRQACRGTGCLRGRSHGPVRVLIRASCSWLSEGLCGQSFSTALPVQEHRGCPLVGVLLDRSVCQALKGGVPFCSLHHSLKGASCSVVQCVRHLMGQHLYCSVADAGVWGERGHGDGSTHYA